MMRAALVALLVPGCGGGLGDPAAELATSDGDDGVAGTDTDTDTGTGTGTSTGGADGADHGEDGVDPDSGESGTSGVDSTGGAEDDGFGMDDDLPLVVKVPDIKEGQVAVGTLVEIQKVRVITPEGSPPHGSLLEVYVQDPEGGARSGILVRLDGQTSLDLQPGDEVTIEGIVRRADGIRYLLAGAEDVEISGAPGDLSPIVLQTADLTRYSPAIMDYEGSLVRVEDVDVTGTTSTGEPVIDGALYLDDRFASELPMLGVGQPLGSVTGALMVTPSGLAIGPRSGDEVVE